MICNICGTNTASVHLTEIINAQMIEVHLCETCADEKGTAFSTHFQMADLLAGLTESSEKIAGASISEKQVCTGCTMSYDEFAKCGRLGCSECYKSFSRQLLPLIKRVQRTAQHLGKKPNRIPQETRSNHDLKLLQDRLRKCVQKEAFEEAASLRDEINAIQEKPKRPKKNKNDDR